MCEYIDIGDDHSIRYAGWHPDRDINPQFDSTPDIDKVGCNIRHKKLDGSECIGFIHFDIPEVRSVFPGMHYWQVESWEPLTVSPSLLCKRCGDHGFIRNGKWVKA